MSAQYLLSLAMSLLVDTSVGQAAAVVSIKNSPGLWERTWGRVYRAFGENDFAITVFGTWLYGFALLLFFNLVFACADITGRPAWMHRYKIQKDKNVPVNWSMYKKAVKRVLFNALVVSLCYQLLNYPLLLWRGAPCGYEGLPSLTTAAMQLLLFAFGVEAGFYYGHRLFHIPYLYKRFHKTHHEWTAPVGLVATYCHPLEHVIVNLFPIAVGPLITGAHLSLVWLWYTVVVFSTTLNHSGYHLPFLPSPEAHDFHHKEFTQNYGVVGLLDRLHNTDNLFRSSGTCKRHVLLLSLSSASEVYPLSRKK